MLHATKLTAKNPSSTALSQEQRDSEQAYAPVQLFCAEEVPETAEEVPETIEEVPETAEEVPETAVKA